MKDICRKLFYQIFINKGKAMPRKKKQQIKVNNTESLEGLMQEVYNDACVQIKQAENVINELATSTIADDVDDASKIAREKSNAMKIKDSGIKIKLEVAKLQSDIIKNNGNLEETNQARMATGAPSLDDFKEIRDMMKQANNEEQSE
jgi:hypothetical protein